MRSPGLAFFGAPAPSFSVRLVGPRFAASIRIFFVVCRDSFPALSRLNTLIVDCPLSGKFAAV